MAQETEEGCYYPWLINRADRIWRDRREAIFLFAAVRWSRLAQGGQGV
jgi:hypothetical protein